MALKTGREYRAIHIVYTHANDEPLDTNCPV